MTLKKQLEAIIAKEDEHTIRVDVAKEALAYGDSDREIESFFNDLSQNGCQSGMVGFLIYYKDTANYFTSHEDEIEELKLEAEENIGSPLKIGTPMTNWLAWFGFEETAYKMSGELGL